MSEYEELDAQLRAWLDEDQSAAESGEAAGWHIDYFDDDGPIFLGHFTPERLLADIAGKRALLDHVAGWPHEYAEDTWYSCGLAVEPHEEDAEPGSGCANEANEGRCTCYLDGRRLAVLRCIAAGYVERSGFKPQWALA